MINRFNRLIKELLQGEVRRNAFQPWEVDLLMDLQSCGLTRSRREEALRRYQRTVMRQLESGQIPPVRFSEFIRPGLQREGPLPGAPLAAEDAPSLNS